VSGGPASIVMAALALVWVGIAVALSILAARRLRTAERVLGAARSNATLLEISPSVATGGSKPTPG
jgi:chloramphenicol 3-O-phosphotransferase